jgi:F-type H+-transporting ATPase subunit delta
VHPVVFRRRGPHPVFQEQIRVPSQSQDADVVAGRYASALYALADVDRSLDRVAEDLRNLRAMCNASADLARLVASPVLSRVAQSAAITELARTSGFHDLTVKFLGTLAKNRRLGAIRSVIAAFLAELARRRGEVTAEVISATPLKPAYLDRVRDALAAALGAKIVLESRVDDAIIGGLKIRVGSRMVDASIATKLQKLRLSMKGIG